jgi:hypothetical protein
MNFYVPEIGDQIKLTVDWAFDLYDEHRNFSMMKYLGDTRDEHRTDWDYWRQHGHYAIRPCVIPAGSILKIDRIYIRKGLSEFSSITFIWKNQRAEISQLQYEYYDEPAKKYKKINREIRFWAKLEDVNKIEFERA